MASPLMSPMKRHCVWGFIGLLGNVAKDEKLSVYTILSTLQSILCKLIIPFVLHNSLISGLFIRQGARGSERLGNSKIKLCHWTYFDLNLLKKRQQAPSRVTHDK